MSALHTADTIARSPSQFSSSSSQDTLHDSDFENSPIFDAQDQQPDSGEHNLGCISEADKIWIPANHSNRSRTLILCFDGTGDKFDMDVSG